MISPSNLGQNGIPRTVLESARQEDSNISNMIDSDEALAQSKAHTKLLDKLIIFRTDKVIYKVSFYFISSINITEINQDFCFTLSEETLQHAIAIGIVFHAFYL